MRQVWWPEDWPAEQTQVRWHGTDGELAQLHLALRHYCNCRFDQMTGEVLGRCGAHTVLADQSALDHLVHVRRMRAWFVSNEMGPRTSRELVAPGANANPRTSTTPSTVLPVDTLSNLDSLYEAYHRQALQLAYGEIGDFHAAEEIVTDALLTVWRENGRPEVATSPEGCRLLARVRSRSQLWRAYRGTVPERRDGRAASLARLLVVAWDTCCPRLGIRANCSGPWPACRSVAEPLLAFSREDSPREPETQRSGSSGRARSFEAAS